MKNFKDLPPEVLYKFLKVEKASSKLDIIIPICMGIFGLVASIILATMTSTISRFDLFISIQILLFGIYGVWGIRIVPAQTEWIIEEFGKYKKTLKSGWRFLCLPGIVDVVVNDSINLQRQKLKIVDANEMGVEVDFNCGASAPVDVEVWYQINNSFLWHYRIANPSDWFHDQVSAFLQPILERRTLDEARKSKRKTGLLYRKKEDNYSNPTEPIYFIDSDAYENDLIAHKKKCEENPNYNESISEDDYQISFKDYVEHRIGVEWTDLLIIDIQIPEEIQQLRKLELAAEIDKKSRSTKSRGYYVAITEIQKLAKDSGHDLSYEEAEKLYKFHMQKEALENTGANITLIGQDITNILASLIKNGGN